MHSRAESTTQQRVIVVGAGVSGCACAATLSAGGVPVTLVNPALDHVCEPSFGPEMRDAGPRGSELDRVLGALPQGMREAWREALMRSPDGSVSAVDRRLASVRTKQVLEGMEGVELRQGLVVGVELVTEPGMPVATGPEDDHGASGETDAPRECRRVRVQTAFGEELYADAVVVAVGLALGGCVMVGEAEFGAGRYGQPAAEGLKRCLLDLGAEMRGTVVEVGACCDGGAMEGCADGAVLWERWIEGNKPGSDRRYATVDMERVGVSRARGAEAREGPQSPYEVPELWRNHALVAAVGERGKSAVVALPDGVATGEIGLAVGWPGPTSRPACVIKGLVVMNAGESGRLCTGDGASAVWVTGRAAGAASYLESLMAGLGTGAAIASALNGGGADAS